MMLFQKFRNSIIRPFAGVESILLQALNLLQRLDKLKLGLICLAQILSGLLDLAGVVIIGAVCALSIQGIESHQPGTQTSKVLNLLHIQNYDFHLQIIIMGSLSISLLLLKTLFAIVFTRKTFKFLSIKGAEISGDLISKILSKDLLYIKKRTSQEILFIISDGIRNLTSGILATSVTMVADISMLLILSAGLYVIDPIIALSTTILFILIAFILYRLLHLRAEQIGIQVEKLIVQSNQKIIEVLSTYRESVVHGRRQFYARQIASLRRQYGEISAELMFQPYIGKYVIELFAIFAAFGLSGFEFATKNAVHAISILSIFLAASTRIAPAILRVQQGSLMIKTSSGTGRSTLNLVRELTNSRLIEPIPDRNFGSHEGFSPTILLKNLFFSYPSKEAFSVGPISMEGRAGESIAIVGPSGAGKTTLVDLILGVLVAQEGVLEISGCSPFEAIQKWPGSISYVPQDVEIVSGTIRENVGLGYEFETATDERVWRALEIAQLKATVQKMDGQLDAEVGERGSKLSGGQRQRLGVARAMFTSPKLLVLDEATSALDGQTELDMSSAIEELAGKVTVLVVAHRLSTVRNVEKVIYMDGGKIMAVGSFAEVRRIVPQFDKQAKLMGI